MSGKDSGIVAEHAMERRLIGERAGELSGPALDSFLPTVGYRGSSLDFLGYWLARDTHLNFQLIDVVRKCLQARGWTDPPRG